MFIIPESGKAVFDAAAMDGAKTLFITGDLIPRGPAEERLYNGNLKDVFGNEITSWICIFSVLPFAILGFVTYNGMKAEEVIWSLIKYEFLVPKKLTFKPTNFYNEILKERRDKY